MAPETKTTRRRYGAWAGDPFGQREDVTRCVATVGGGSMWGPANERQCSRSRGHGPLGDLCKQHAPKNAGNAPEASR